jgi:hypothetical protein
LSTLSTFGIQNPKFFKTLSKKRFKEGLESLFGDTDTGGTFQRENALLKSGEERKKQEGKKSDRKRSIGAFTELFKEKVTEKIIEKVEESREKEEKKPLAGLDALIRKTLDKSTVEVSKPARGQRRVTFVVDEALLEKLRAIAQMEKKYLRELVSGAVQEFIENYESESGKS